MHSGLSHSASPNALFSGSPLKDEVPLCKVHDCSCCGLLDGPKLTMRKSSIFHERNMVKFWKGFSNPPHSIMLVLGNPSLSGTCF